MKTPAIILLLSGISLAQGPLQPSTSTDPTTGPISPLNVSGIPQPTMKTLHEVEPRTPLVAGSQDVTIGASGTITVSQPGSYYLTKNVAVTSGNGITFNASPVTLDLNGFNISTSADPAAGNGIHITSPFFAVTIKNGTILNTGTASSSALTLTGAGFQYGVYAYQPNQAHISDISVAGTSDLAIYADISASTLVENCIVRNCVSGIKAATITNCSANAISGDAIYGRNITSCSGSSYTATGIIGTLVSGCTGISLTGNGILAGGNGIQPGLVSHCTGITTGSNPNAAGIDASSGIVTDFLGSGTGSSSKSIIAATASACVATGGASSITNRYNMAASP